MRESIREAHVYDPAMYSLEGESHQPRLQVEVTDEVDLKKIKHSDDRGLFAVYHYGRFMAIEWSDPDRDDPIDLAELHKSSILEYFVFPVTVVNDLGIGTDFYMFTRNVRRVLAIVNESVGPVSGGHWTLVGDEPATDEGRIQFRLQHTAHHCVRCIREASAPDLSSIPTGFPVNRRGRMLDLCLEHEAERRAHHFKARSVGA